MFGFTVGALVKAAVASKLCLINYWAAGMANIIITSINKMNQTELTSNILPCQMVPILRSHDSKVHPSTNSENVIFLGDIS